MTEQTTKLEEQVAVDWRGESVEEWEAVRGDSQSFLRGSAGTSEM